MNIILKFNVSFQLLYFASFVLPSSFNQKNLQKSALVQTRQIQIKNLTPSPIPIPYGRNCCPTLRPRTTLVFPIPPSKYKINGTGRPGSRRHVHSSSRTVDSKAVRNLPAGTAEAIDSQKTKGETVWSGQIPLDKGNIMDQRTLTVRTTFSHPQP